MKILLYGNNHKEKNILFHLLSKEFPIKTFIKEEIKIEEVLKKEKDWVILQNDLELNILMQHATVILYCIEKNDKISQELLKKYPSKVIMIKNKKERNIFLNALREGEIIKYQ